MSRLQIITSFGAKVGIKDQATIGKANNVFQALDQKAISKTIHDTAKTLICLELAAGISGVVFDKEFAIKLSGLRKSAYQNCLNNVSKMLDLDKTCTVQELCVQLGCTEVKHLVESVLASYAQVYGQIKDIKHPQYTAAAVFTACKVNKIKIKKEPLISMSHLKLAQWKELTEEFLKFYNSLDLTKVKNSEADKMEFDMIDLNTSQDGGKTQENEPQVEDYEVWKERIMNAAMKKITMSVFN